MELVREGARVRGARRHHRASSSAPTTRGSADEARWRPRRRRVEDEGQAAPSAMASRFVLLVSSSTVNVGLPPPEEVAVTRSYSSTRLQRSSSVETEMSEWRSSLGGCYFSVKGWPSPTGPSPLSIFFLLRISLGQGKRDGAEIRSARGGCTTEPSLHEPFLLSSYVLDGEGSGWALEQQVEVKQASAPSSNSPN